MGVMGIMAAAWAVLLVVQAAYSAGCLLLCTFWQTAAALVHLGLLLP